MIHIFKDILINSILVTGLVVVMMMMIESFNIESKGRLFKGLRSSRIGGVFVGALLGAIPGCMGGFATVSLYTHGMLSLGALVAMMIATSGDESFAMLAMIPDKAMLIFVVTFVIAVVCGIVVDLVHSRHHAKHCSKTDHEDCTDTCCQDGGYQIHSEKQEAKVFAKGAARHFGWKRIVMLLGVGVFIAALGFGLLEHGHEHGHEEAAVECDCGHHHEVEAHHHEAGHHHEFTINLLSEDWMNVLFAVLSITVLAVLLFGSDHFVEEHLWKHVVAGHLPGIFAWTFGVLFLIGVGMHFVDLESWIGDNTAMMILLAAAIGIIPESGPHLVFVTLFASGIVPLPVLLASCISQDGHAALPLLAESKKTFIKAKAINFVIALAAGYLCMLMSF